MPTVETKIASEEHISAPESLKPLAMKNVAGTTAINRSPVQDTLGLTKQQIKDYKLPTDGNGKPVDALAWVRNPDANMYRDAPEDRISTIMSERDGEVIRHGNKVVIKADCVLVRYPMGYREQAQKRIDAEAARSAENLELGVEGAMESHIDLDAEGEPIREMTVAQKKAHLARMHQMHKNSGMIGPTAHMSLVDAIRYMGGPEAVAQDEDRYRLGSVHREMSREAYAEMMTGGSTAKKYFGSTGIGDPTPKTIQQKREGSAATGRRAAAIAAQPKR